MSEIYFTSDTHFHHKRIIEFCPNTRLGSTIEEHDQLLIEAINRVVTPKDTLYMLGDISWSKVDRTKEILSQLNGHKNLILGNHDHQISQEGFSKIFEHISHYREVKIDKTDVIMCHYPMVEWNKGHHGSVMLHGHCHGSYVGAGKIVDVGVDGILTKNMEPVHWETIAEYVKNREVIKHH